MSNGTCKNCGGTRGIHHYLTFQCPFGGVEARFDRKQEYMDTKFEPVTNEVSQLRNEVSQLRDAIEELNAEIVRLNKSLKTKSRMITSLVIKTRKNKEVIPEPRETT